MNHHQKGTQVNHTARSTRTPFLRTGFFATLRGLLRAEGSGAPSSGVGARTSPLKLAALTVLAALCALALGATPASAALTFEQIGEITGPEAGVPFGSLKSESVAVNDQNGHILIADSGAHRVYDFASATDTAPTVWDGTTTPAGEFTGNLAVAVDNSTGDVYVSDSAHAVIDKFDQDGNLISGFGDTTPTPDGQLKGLATPATEFSPATQGSFGIAVDQATGNLYAIDAGHEVIDAFDEAGAFLPGQQVTENPGELYGGGGAYTDGIAVNDQSGELLVSDSWDLHTYRFELATATFIAAIDGSETPAGGFGFGYTSVAADNSNGQIYVNDTEHQVVDSYNPNATYSGLQITGTPFAPFGGVAVDQGSSAVYVADGTGAVEVFEALVVPGTTTAAPSNLTATSATLNGTVNPDEVPLKPSPSEGCFFEWGETESYGEIAPCEEPDASEVGEGNTPVAVHADLSGLHPGTTYHFRLVAANANGTAPGADQSFTTGATIDSTSVANVTATSADLGAQINPQGLETTYHFEYGAADCSTSACTSVPVPDAALGSGTEPVAVARHIQGLQPATVYHYRVLALTPLGTVPGPDLTFTTQPPATPFQLPDGRAYEQVTPVEKGAGSLWPPFQVPGFGGYQAALSGDAFAFPALVPLPGSAAGGNGSVYLATRGSAGWSTESLLPPQAGTTSLLESPYIFGFSPDLSRSVLQDGGHKGQDFPPLFPGEPAENENLFLRDNHTASYQLLNVTPPTAAPSPAGFEGASADYSHLFFTSEAKLTPDALEGAVNLYQWSAGQVSLVSLIPTAPATSCGGAGPTCSPAHNASLGAGNFGATPFVNAVSPDASRVYFQATNTFSESGRLYLRQGDTTVQISASQKTNGAGPGGTDPNGPLFPASWPSSADGSRAFFTSCEQLTDDSTAVFTENCYRTLRNFPGALARHGQDLYSYDADTGQLTDLTVDHNPGDPFGADVQTVLGSSADGSYVYFVANGVLAPGATPGDCLNQVSPPDATCNLYLSHDGAITHVATIAEPDQENWYRHPQVRITPDGIHLAFQSTASLTGYDNTVASGPDCGQNPVTTERFGLRCPEVFLYDAATGHLACASCNPTGARPLGPSLLDPPEGESTRTGASNSIFDSGYFTHNLSTDGARLFFTTADSLAPADTNARADLYEYENGAPHLISSGTSAADSTFIDATPTGSDVFFETSARLAATDTDGANDIYDARVGGGTPSPVNPVECTGDGCQQPAVPPNDATPGSLTFNGAGNLLQCPKGKVKRRGKCVARKHKRHHKKHHKRHAKVSRGGAK